MSTTLRHLRPLFIGLVAVLLAAGVAFASKPTAVPDGRTVASESAGKTVPVQAEPDTDAPDAGENAEPAADTESADNCTTDPTGLTDEELAAMTHGSVVCWAAQQATPDGYANHGAWVSEWAKKNHGADASATAGDASGAAADASGAAAGHVPTKAAKHVGQGKPSGD